MRRRLFLCLATLTFCRLLSAASPAGEPEDRLIDDVLKAGIPIVDYHVHLRGGMNIEKAIERQKKTGVKIGVLKNLGKGWPIETDEQLRVFLDSVKGKPLYVGLQVNDRDWHTKHSPELLARLDFVLGDTMIMAMPDENGRPQKLWMEDQYKIEDVEAWMQRYVRYNLRVLAEPITILANPTYLPDSIKDRYDELWTDERMRLVIQAAIKNNVALEINASSEWPHDRFIAMAKRMGAKFSLGTNNFDDKPIDMARCFEAIKRHGLRRADFYLPKKSGADPAQKPERLALWPGDSPVSKAVITAYRPVESNGTAVVICPGGGYGMVVAGPEGHGIARWLNRHGITGIVLEYELPKGRPLVPLHDVQRAIRTARVNAATWKIDASRVGVMGFSAGGHLASTAGTHFDAGDPEATDPVESLSCRPDFMVLIYPVITMGEKTHRGSKRNLLGKDPAPETVVQFSGELQVTENTPPAFLAHAQDDKVVVPDNSRMFHEALRAKGVGSEYLKLPSGGHGLNRYRGPMWDAWQREALRWLATVKTIPESSVGGEK